mgnify:CR=1 FL=1
MPVHQRRHSTNRAWTPGPSPSPPPPSLPPAQLPFCHSVGSECRDLASAVQLLQPTVLVGLSTTGPAPPWAFSQDVLQVRQQAAGGGGYTHV